jgi:TonB family protein
VFENLVASSAKTKKPFGSAVMSFSLQAALMYGAVVATKGAAETIREIIQDTTMVFLEAPKEAPPPEAPPPEAVVSANPPPKGFQTIIAVEDIPTEIPPVDLTQKFNPDDFTGKGIEGGIAAGIVGGTGPVIEGEVFLAAELEDRPRIISIEEPKYPAVLQSAGITGRVVFDFVVDTLGRVNANSIKIVSSTNKAFEQPAVDALATAVFAPGKVQGAPVQVLVRQAISFTQ